ncbi:hopene-associated glycosyltransferase HpnB [Candidatus Protofrankia californiensis]|uniref:Hopene-associated glycosyltransferase HpnB n=1 Tax=Candidatus Protofrankia californiensis TaxID=1839754 RepID=A0A1C3P009_9ACTN|nr:hopene-associated glycosyltransferase HpnB [Candidatus Protofrankia californiensis]
MMTLAACAVLSMLVWLVLAGGHGMFWRTDTRLDTHDSGATGAAEQPGGWPAITMIVPARDEAEMLPKTLPTLLGQDYPGQLRVVLVDDSSDDGTGDVARAIGRATGTGTGTGNTLTVVAGQARPAGWAGKVWAMEQGVRAAPPDAEWLLFTDADIAHGPHAVTRLVSHATRRGLDLTSLMAVLRTSNRWERLVIPAFVYFFAQLYPFRRANRPTARTSAAAGGCVLLRRAALERAGGIAAIRGAVIDDCSLARAVKRSGGRIWLGLADHGPGGVRSVRPYPGLADLWKMISRSAYTQLRHSPVLLAGTVAGLALTYLLPPLAAVVWLAGLVTGAGAGGTATVIAGVAGLGAWAIMTATYVPMLRYYRQPVWTAVALPAVAFLYLLMTVDSAVAHWRGRGAAWKGRAYSAVNSDGVTGT